MTPESANDLIFSLRRMKEIPESKERDKAIAHIKERIEEYLLNNTMSSALLGEEIGWDRVETILKEGLNFVKEMKSK